MQSHTRQLENVAETFVGNNSEGNAHLPLAETSTILQRETMPSEPTRPVITDTESSKKMRQRLDLNALDPAKLQDEIALENALRVLESHLEDPAVDQETIMREFVGVQNLFEFVTAGVNDRAASAMKAHLADGFPPNAASFEASLACLLLGQLSLYFWHQEYPLPGLDECHISVDLTRSALKALSLMNFAAEAKSPVSDDVDDEFEGFFRVKKTKQRDRKKNRRGLGARTVSIDAKPFERLHVEVPRSAEEAMVLEKKLLDDQKGILMHYLDVLRKPELAPIFIQAYLKAGIVSATNEEVDSSAQVLGADSMNIVQQAEDVSGGYPNIQPMKAALYFDSVEGFGDWPILISTRADKNLREAKRDDQKTFRIYLKKIRELSNGHFSDDNQKRLTGSDNDVPIYEAKMTRDTRLVYQVDCIKEFGLDVERQVLRIFGIYTHAQLGRNFWDAVSKHLSGKGKEYKKRCVHRTEPASKGDKVYAPATFPPNADVGEPVSPTNMPDLGPDEQQELHSLLVLEKFVTFSQALLHSILADQDVAHVFHMSPAEQDIVKHAGSCYVLGRSGTGKTTTMLFKMLGIERAYENLRHEYDGELNRPRQLFVTQSRVLAEKVQEYYVKLAMSQAAAQRTAEESSKLAAQQKEQEEKGLVDRDEEEFHHGTLPKSFKELKDDHFPLFVTFDHLCRLLEADYRQLDSRLDVTSGGQDEVQVAGNTEVASDYMLQRRQSFVSYITFVNEYWPHLPQSLTKNLDPALIFAEFMGVIKGSEDAVQTEKGYLDREQYLQVSHRQQGTFSSRREAVYALFQAYLKMKQERREWDAADRTHVMLRGLREFGVPGRKVDFIYVDEAQDNLLIDALVLRSMCSNPDGLFWAGDTAQTISAGSSFRFDDLKAFLYRLESKSSTVTEKKQPAAFQLTVNYRSHGGIVNVAHSIVQLITQLWPHAIDSLSEERGIVDGLKPVFFSGWNQDTVHYEQFLFGASGSQIEFGAQQCILVRDDAARDRLREQVGDIGLVLTLYESKGLEFNDVLLYNFFEDSTVDEARWRVVLNALPAQKHLKCPQFDETRHSGVCRELKFLYVAITRARKNLWIADCSDKCEALRTFWDAYNLVDNLSAADTVPRLATTSTEEEWAETARTLFDKRRYLQAARSYERANMPRERDVAHAYYLREQARQIARSRGTIANPRRSALIEAANAFNEAAREASLRSEKLAYHRIAGECYFEAEELYKAAKAYLLAEDYTRAAQVFRQGGYFDDAVDAIENHKSRIPPQEVDSILNVAKLHYLKNQDLDRATHLFADIEEALEYMSDYGFDVARVTLLEQYGRFSDAADIHLQEGRAIDAIRLFLKDTQNSKSIKRAAETVLQGLWNELSFAVTVPSQGSVARSQLDQLLALSRRLTTSSPISLSPVSLDELVMFRAMADGDSNLLRSLSHKFIEAHSHSTAALLCLDFVFQKAMNIQIAPAEVVLQTLQNFATFTREMQNLLSQPEPLLQPDIQRLFAVSQIVEMADVFLVRKGSFLHSRISQSGQVSIIATDEAENYQLHAPELTRVFQDAVRMRLNRRTADEDFVCSKAESLRLCPAFLAFGTCNSNCGSSHDSAAVGQTAYHMRIRNILQQILICQLTRASEDLSRQQTLWISRLYHSMFPMHIRAGSWLEIDFTSIPEAEKGLPVVKEWLRAFLYTASFQRIGRLQFLSTIAYTINLALFFEKDAAVSHFNRAACITSERPRSYIRTGGRYIVQDLRDFLSYDGVTSLSAGVLFIKFVCEERLPIDIALLCNLVEQLCASYVIAYRMQKNTSLHDLTLSRKWLLKLSTEEKLQNQDINLLQMLVNLIPILLEETYTTVYITKSSFLTYDGHTTIRNQLRNIIAARLCKSFTLLGYNIPDDKTRISIYSQITSLRKAHFDARFSWIFSDYMDAKTWMGLVRALRRTAERDAGTAEELVHLCHFSKDDQAKGAFKGIQKIVFKKQVDIPALLRGELVSDLNPKAAAFVPRHILEAQAKAEAGVTQDEDEDESGLSAPPAEENSGIDHGIDLEAAAQAADQERVEQVVEPPSDEELKAAALITKLYRRKLARKQHVSKKGREADRERFYRLYREQPFAEWTNLRYKAIFLGFLPLVLLCVEAYNTEILASKKKAMLRAKVAPHHEYESVTAQIDSAITLNKRIRKIKEQLDPKAAFHAKQSLPELIVLVKDVETLAADLPEAVTSSTREDLETAVDMIVPKPIVPNTKPVKPELVVDLNDYEAY